MFDRLISLSVYNDSKSLFNVIVEIHMKAEKRFLIDLSIHREAFEMRELDDVFRIPSQENPADALTKESPSPTPTSSVRTNKLHLNAEKWMKRNQVEPAYEKRTTEREN